MFRLYITSPQQRCLKPAPLRDIRGIAGAPALLPSWNICRPYTAHRVAERSRCLAFSSADVKSIPQSLPIDADALHLPRYCAGCGVGLQAADPDLPG